MENDDEITLNSIALKDFYLSAYLLAKGNKLSKINRDNPRQVFFIFEKVANKERLLADFLYGRALVEPKSFVSAIKELKQLLYTKYD